MREDVTCNPISLNGIVKLLNEKIISNYCLANHINYTFLRLYNTYAGHDTFSVLYKLWKAAHYDETFTLNNNGLSQRDFIHVEDVASVIMKIIKIEPNKTCINIGSGKAVKIFDIYQIVKNKYPKMKVKHTSSHEIEYARADNTELNKLITHDFQNVLSFAEKI